MPVQPVMGQIMPFAGSKVPTGWALCNGALLPIRNYNALFSLLGTYYGGDGIATFALPDLRGRAILGAESAGRFPAGMVSGANTVTLNVTQIPNHQHGILVSNTDGGGRGIGSPTNGIFATNTLPAGNATKIFLATGKSEVALATSSNVVPEGSNAAHQNMQPYLTISYLIALQGSYPSRD